MGTEESWPDYKSETRWCLGNKNAVFFQCWCSNFGLLLWIDIASVACTITAESNHCFHLLINLVFAGHIDFFFWLEVWSLKGFFFDIIWIIVKNLTEAKKRGNSLIKSKKNCIHQTFLLFFVVVFVVSLRQSFFLAFISVFSFCFFLLFCLFEKISMANWWSLSVCSFLKK